MENLWEQCYTLSYRLSSRYWIWVICARRLQDATHLPIHFAEATTTCNKYGLMCYNFSVGIVKKKCVFHLFFIFISKSKNPKLAPFTFCGSC